MPWFGLYISKKRELQDIEDQSMKGDECINHFWFEWLEKWHTRI